MSTSDWIAIGGIFTTLLVTTIGSTAMLAYKLGARLERLESGLNRLNDKFDSLDNRVTRLETIVEDIQKTLSVIQVTIAQMQVKLEVMWQHHLSRSNSPKVLNEAGLQALEASQIGGLVIRQYDNILSLVRKANPKNAYQAQEALIAIVNQYKIEKDYVDMLEEASFSSGYDIDSLLFVAALSIRDKVIADLNLH